MTIEHLYDTAIRLRILAGEETAEFSLPCGETHIRDTLREIDADDPDENCLYIDEVMYPKQLQILESKVINIDELNFLAKVMLTFTDNDLEQFYTEVGQFDFFDMTEIINLAFAVARLPERYDGQTFPAFCVHERYLSAKISYGGKCETIFMPEDTLAIDKAVEPHKPAYVTEIGSDYKSLRAAVGDGLLEMIPFLDDACMVGNEEAKLIGLEENRRFEYSIVAGPFFICGEDGDEFCSLSDELCEKYVREFSEPEEIPQEEVEADVGLTLIGFL